MLGNTVMKNSYKIKLWKPQGGYSCVNVTGGPTEPNILHPKKLHGRYIVHPKKYKTGNFRNFTCRLFESCFRILRELWLELRKNYKPGGNSNPKKYAQIF